MNWDDLAALLEQSHSIGAHTASHARLSLINDKDQLEFEIISIADVIDKKLGLNTEHFAYTFGDLASFSQEALTVAKQRFSYIHFGLRGNNIDINFPFGISRDSIDAQTPLFKMGTFLEGAADSLYSGSKKKLG